MTEPWSNQSTSLLIVQSTPGAFSGFFVYSPVPGPGNLIGSWAGSPGVDPFGNPYPAGLSSEQGTITGTTITGSSFQGINFVIDNQGIRLYQAATVNPPPPPPPPTPPVPYKIGGVAGGTAATFGVGIVTPTAANDLIYVAANAAFGGATVTSVTDSKGNTYVAGPADATQIPTSVWIASGATTALTTSDSITMHYSSSTGQKAVSVLGVRGLPSAPLDASVSAAGSSNNPMVTSGALAEATEIALCAFGTANGGGNPSLAAGMTVADQRQSGGSQYLTVGYQALSSAAAFTAGASITSARWAALLTTFKEV